MPQGGDTIVLDVGLTASPVFQVTINGLPEPRAHYVYSTARGDTVVRVEPSGDAITVVGRGSDTLFATLVGATAGLDTLHRDSIVVIGKAFNNTVDSLGTGVMFNVISASTKKRVHASSLSATGSDFPVANNTVTWVSNNPAGFSITKVDSANADITPIANSVFVSGVTADSAYAIFDGVDTLRVPVRIKQLFYQYDIVGPSGTAADLPFNFIGDTARIVATAVDSSHSALLVNSQPSPTGTISSTLTSVATVNAGGLVRAVGNGNATIVVRVNGADSSNTINVNVHQIADSIAVIHAKVDTIPSIGGTLSNVNAIAYDSARQQLPSSDITWSSSNNGIASPGAATPTTITGNNVGTALVIARAGNVADTITVVVRNDPASVRLNPDTAIIRSLGDTAHVSFGAFNSAGDSLTSGVAFTLTSSNPSVATVNATGRVTAQNVGKTVITGKETSSGRQDATQVIVTNYPDTITVVGQSAFTLPSVGDTMVVDNSVMTMVNARGASLQNSAASWTTNNPFAADVVVGSDSVVRVIATGAGFATITAQSPGDSLVRRSLQINVTNAVDSLAFVSLNGTTFTSLGQTLQFTANAYNANGTLITGAPMTWSVTTGGAKVSIDPSTGLATSTANGTAHIHATSGNGVLDTTVTVQQVVSVANSSISAAQTSIVANGTSTSQVNVFLHDARDSVLTFGGATVQIFTTLGSLASVVDHGNGRYSALLTSGTVAGVATLSATVNGSNLTASTLPLVADVAAKYLVTSTSYSPVAGSAVTVSAQLADQNNNPVSTSGQSVVWSSTGGGSFTPATSTTNAAGVAQTSFTTNASASTHTVTATTGSITGSSSTIVSASGTGANYLVTAVTVSPIAGSTDTIFAQLLDGNNNPVALAGQTVSWTTTFGTLSSGGTSSTNASGVAKIVLTTPTASGTVAQVTATTGASTGSVNVTTVPGPAVRGQTTITRSASSVQAGGTVTITVRTKDANGNNLTTGGSTITVATTLGSLSAVTDNGDGTYTSTLTTSATGTATISGTLNGQTITSGNPTVTVTVATASAATTTIAASATSITANGTSTSTITVQAKDAQGNNFSTGGATVTLARTGTGTLGAVTDNNDGTYTATLTAPVNTGSATISGTINGNAITTGNPVVTYVAGAANRNQSTIAVSASSVTVGTAVTVTVQLKDANGNNLATGGATVAIASSGTGSLSATTDNNNGTYTASLNSPVVGSTTISATLGGNPITTGDPTVTFTVGTATQMAVNSGNNQSAVAGSAVTTNPSVVVRDANGNPVSGVSVTFAVQSGGGSRTGGNATTGSDGVATVGSWTLGTAPGGNTLRATSAGLTGSPIDFTATATVGAASAATSTVSADSAALASTHTSQITVQLKDASGNNLTASGGTVTMSANIGTLSAVTNNGDGSYTATYTATTSGAATINASINGAGMVSSAAITVSSGAATQIAVNAGNNQTAVAGSAVATAPSVLVTDANGNPVNGVAVTFAVTGGGGSRTGGAQTTNASGIATVGSWTLGTGTGPNTLQATSAGLTGSPVSFSATATVGAASTATSLLTPTAASVTAGGSTTITVQLKDGNGNNLTAGGASITLATTLGSLSPVVDNGDGTYSSTLSTSASGTATVTGRINGASITDNAVVTVTVGGASAAQTTATVPAGTAGAQTSIVIQAKDAQGNALAAVGATIVATVTGANSATATITDNLNGTYTAKYTPTVAGTDAIAITLGGTAISGSPYSSVVSAAALSNFLVEAAGGGAIGTQTAGTSFSIRITARDASGNTITTYSGGANNATLTSATGTLAGAPITTAAFVNGVLTQTVTVTNTGSITITATKGGTNGTSAAFTVNPGGASPVNTTIGATSPVTAGSNSTITVTAKDGQGNNLASSGGTVTLATTLGTLSAVTNNNNGTYTATLSTTTNGSATISGTINGQAITSGNPVVTINIGSANAAQSTITAGQSTLTANGTATTTITVRAKDSQGNNLTAGGATVTLTRAGGGSLSSTASGTAATVTADDQGNGTYTATLTAPLSTATPATISGTINAAAITSGNATVSYVAGTSTVANSTISVSQTSVTVGTAVTVTVQLKDGSGNNLTSGGATVVISRSGTGALTSTTDNGNGTYTATLSSLVAGSATVSATIGGNPITSGNQTVTFNAAAASQISVNGGNNQSAAAGTLVPTNPSVVVRDANGNPVSGVSVTFTVQAGGGSRTGGSQTTGTDGVATVGSWTLGAAAGSNTLRATSAGLTGSPVDFTATGTVGGASAATSTVTSNQAARTSGQTATITVTLRDANNNSLAASGGTVTLSTNIGTLGAVNDAGTGTYTATYTATSVGTATISATINGATIASTASITVTAGAAANIAVNAGNNQSVTAGSLVPTNPSVLVTDAAGNPVNGVAVTFAVQAGGGSRTGGAQTTNASGIATVGSWTLGATAGANTLRATSAGLAGSPVDFSATGTVGAAATATSTITALPTTVNAGTSSAITVQLKDANSNNLTSGGAVVTLSTTLGSLSAVADAGNGSYTATLSTTTSGSATITGRIAGNLITDNEVVTINPAGASATTTTISVSAASITANGTATSTITVQAKDAQGNNITTGGATVTLTRTGTGSLSSVASGTAATVTADDQGNGTYTATLTAPTATGSATISGTIGGSGIASGNKTVTYVAGAANRNHSTISVSSNSVAVGTAVTATVQLKDVNDNLLTTGGATVVISRSGAGALTSTTDNGDGTYTATLSSATIGSSTISATLGGLAITTGNQSVAFTAAAATQISVSAGNNQSANAGSTVPTPPAVLVQDANGNPVANVNVDFAVTGGGGSIVPASTATVATNSSGIAALTSWTLGTTAGANTLTATSTGLTNSPLTFTATGTVGAASAATSTITSSNATRRSGQTATITVQLKDANGNNLSVNGGTVTLSTSIGTLGAVTYTVNGQYTATFTATVVGTATITGTINGAGISDNETITINPSLTPSAATTTISAGASSVAVGGTTTITVQAKDAAGNTMTTGGAAVTLTSTSGTLTSTATGTAATVTADDQGNGTYTATLNAPAATGSTTISGTIAAAAITSGNATVTFVAGTADRTTSTISVSSASVAVGTPVTATVQLKDAGGNNLTSGGATVVISRSGTGNLTSTTDNGNGTYTATLSSSTTGSATISATLGGLAITTGNQTVAFTAGTATQIAVNAGDNQSAVAGSVVPTPPSVVVRDANGNPVNAVNVDFEVTGGGGSTVPVSIATVATNSSGIASLTSWTLGTTAGANTLTATATGLTGSPVTFTATGTVGSASTATSTITSNQANRQSGQTATITVQLKDANGNNLSVSGGTVTLSTNIGTIGAVTNTGLGTYTATFTATTAGTATITGTLNGAGFTDTEVITVTASATPAAATTTISASPTSIAANGVSTSTITVQAKDASGNSITTGGATVTLTLIGSGALGSTATPGPLATVTADDQGNGTYTATLTSGTLARIDTVTGTINAGGITSVAAVTLTATAATKYLVTSASSNVTAGDTVLITAQLADANNNPVATAGRTITWRYNTNAGAFAPGAQLVSATSITDASGQAQVAFEVGTNSNDNHRVRATDNTGKTGTSAVINIDPAALDHFAVETSGGGAIGTQTAGTAFDIAITAQDQFNNTVDGFTGTVTVTSTSAITAGGGATANFVAGVLDPHSITLTTAGIANQTISVNDGSGHLGASNTFTIDPAVADHITLVTQPSGTATAGVDFAQQPVVEIRDQFENVETGDNTSTITAAINTGTSTLQGTTTVTVSGGVSTFGQGGNTALSYNKAETITIDFTSSAVGNTETSGNVVVSPAGPDHLTITTQPSTAAAAGNPFDTQPVIEVRDAFDNVTPDADGETVAATVEVGTGALSGTTSVLVAGGVATFVGSGMSYDTTENNVQLRFTLSNPVLFVISDPFDVP